jgi:uncharacterized repeat protein (TIGR03843 family)
VSDDAEPESSVSVEAVLSRGEITVHGRIPGSSNVTLLATCVLEDAAVPVVYKPARGERPLWDFPSGLHRREVAAYVVSEALGWHLVPLTVERADGPLGAGSVQRFVEEDGTSHYFTLREERRWRQALRRIAAFDVIANNADRKSGHVLLAEGRLWAIDNGLSFHCQPKLRTVIWDFGGEKLSARELSAVETLSRQGLPAILERLLDAQEIEALERRIETLLAIGHLPHLPDHEWRPYPWPLV